MGRVTAYPPSTCRIFLRAPIYTTHASSFAFGNTEQRSARSREHDRTTAASGYTRCARARGCVVCVLEAGRAAAVRLNNDSNECRVPYGTHLISHKRSVGAPCSHPSLTCRAHPISQCSSRALILLRRGTVLLEAAMHKKSRVRFLKKSSVVRNVIAKYSHTHT